MGWVGWVPRAVARRRSYGRRCLKAAGSSDDSYGGESTRLPGNGNREVEEQSSSTHAGSVKNRLTGSLSISVLNKTGLSTSSVPSYKFNSIFFKNSN